MDALEVLYRELGEGMPPWRRSRTDIHSPTSAAQSVEAPMAHYLKSMSGASPHFGTAALRFSSDIVAWRHSGEGMRREKMPALPGNRWLGIVLLFSSANGELLAIMNDGVIQRMRVGGTNGVATRYLARADAQTVGLIGSGWQAGTQVMAVCEARAIKKIKVYQPDASQSREVRRRNGAAGRRGDRAGGFVARGGSRCRYHHHLDQLSQTVSRNGGARRRRSSQLHATGRSRRRGLARVPAAGGAYQSDGKQQHLVATEQDAKREALSSAIIRCKEASIGKPCRRYPI